MSSSPKPTPKTRRKEPIGFKVRKLDWVKNVPVIAYVPATQSDADRLKPLHHKDGDLVFADFRKPRNPGFHRLAHAIGKLVVQNIDGFGHLTPHEAIKRLQMESGVGCETVMVNMNSIWSNVLEWISTNLGPSFASILRVALKEFGVKVKLIPLHIPRSISYDSMDQEEFFGVVKGLCKFIAERYWLNLKPEEIEAMAEAMSGELDPGK